MFYCTFYFTCDRSLRRTAVLLIGSITAVEEKVAEAGEIGALILVVTVERMPRTVSHRCNKHTQLTSHYYQPNLGAIIENPG